MNKLKESLENPSPPINTKIDNFDKAIKRGGKGRYHGYCGSSRTRNNDILSKRTAGTAGQSTDVVEFRKNRMFQMTATNRSPRTR